MIQPALPLEKGAPVSGQDCAPWLALGRVKGVGGVSLKKIAARFGDPAAVFRASVAELAEIEGLHRDLIDNIANFNHWAEIEKEIQRARAAGIKMIPFSDAAYPARLRAIADPPALLYVKGEIRDNDERAVAIVGSRSASDYGRRVARDLSRGLASLGFTVVSGMARGIDGMAHEKRQSAAAEPSRYLGSGVDRAYPPEHEKLYQRISESGAVISELPIGARPMAFNFPARNRLISGLSLGVVVVEATEKSGSLITAPLPLEQGREVFAVPGEVGREPQPRRASFDSPRRQAGGKRRGHYRRDRAAVGAASGDAEPVRHATLPENARPEARQDFRIAPGAIVANRSK